MHKQKYGKGRRNLVVCSWNVQTLVKNSGNARICRKKAGIGRGWELYTVDRKLDLLVGEVKHYGISVAEMQETKWFGKDVWPAAEGFTFLHSGRSLPANGEDATRNEGVGGLLDAN